MAGQPSFRRLMPVELPYRVEDLLGHSSGGSRDFRVYRGLSAGPEGFALSGSHDPFDGIAVVLPRDGSNSVGDIGFRRSPLTKLAMPLRE